MPRYFFDLIDGGPRPDEEGTVLPDIKAARQEASAALLEIALDEIPYDGPAKEISIAVRDEHGRRILLVRLAYTEEPPDFAPSA